MGEIETALGQLDNRPEAFDPINIAISGAFVSIGPDGRLRVDRGYARREDEPPVPEAEPASGMEAARAQTVETIAARIDGDDCTAKTSDAEPTAPPEPEEDEGMRSIPGRLLTELTAHRTVALREALAGNPQVAFLAALNAMVLKLFYHYPLDSCLDLDAKSVGFASQPAGFSETWSAKSLAAGQRQCQALLPKQPEDPWNALTALEDDQRQRLFAHCVGVSVNAVFESYNRRPRAFAHADRLAVALDLDMAGLGWSPTVDNFLGRVTKARIVAAAREGRGERQAQLIDHLNKAEMAERAQGLLAGTGWLPEPLRTPGRELPNPVEVEANPTVVTHVIDPERTVGETAASGGEPAMGDEDDIADDEPVAEADAPFAHAAE